MNSIDASNIKPTRGVIDVSSHPPSARILDPQPELPSWVVHFEGDGSVICLECGEIVNRYDEGRPDEDPERNYWDEFPRLMDEAPDQYGYLFWECKCDAIISAFTDENFTI